MVLKKISGTQEAIVWWRERERERERNREGDRDQQREARSQWLMPLILAIWEAEIGRIMVEAHPDR
jgi:hypothetical protein